MTIIRAVGFRLNKYLFSNNINQSRLFSYKSSHITETVFIQVQNDDTAKSTDQGTLVLPFLLNLSDVFD